MVRAMAELFLMAPIDWFWLRIRIMPFRLIVTGKNVGDESSFVGQIEMLLFRRFKFTYQSNGYYTIKNEGSGLYLSVKGQGSTSGSNVELSSSATQWQVLPDGTGSYYLVPKCFINKLPDMYSGVPANGKNIEIWNYNMGKSSALEPC